MTILIKSAELTHASDIAALTIELGYVVNETETEEWLSAMLASPNYGVFVGVTDDDIVCGWIVVEKRLSLETGFKAEISGLVTNTKFRRLGLGKQLVLACENWSHKHGLTTLVVSSNSQRQASHLFYKSAGFLHKKTSHKYEKKV